MDFLRMSALELAEKIKSREISSVQVTKYFLNRAEKYNKKYNAFITICKDEAILQAEKTDENIAAGNIMSPLAGIPIAVKDNISTKGIKTTCASKIIEDYIPFFDASVIEKIKEAGLVIIGKTNMDEFAMGSSGETSCFGNTLNPWDESRVPGGSSSGSACAVACGFAPLALGSDTGGSIRQPASYCSIFGLKPTNGAVSRYGLVAFASSLDQIGVFSKNATDGEALFRIISGQDKKDSTSFGEYKSSDFKRTDLKGIRIGMPKQFFSDLQDSEVKQIIQSAADILTSLGAEAEFFDMSVQKYAVPIYHIISSAEASSNLSRFDGVRYGKREKSRTISEMYRKTRTSGLGEEVKRRIITGSFVLHEGYYDEYYSRAIKARRIFRNQYREAFEKYDIILGPTTSTPAFKIAEKKENPLEMYLNDVYTASANLAGIPAVSIPCGFTEGGLPVGLQLSADLFNEKILFEVSDIFERNTAFHKKSAPICSKEAKNEV